MTEAEILGRLSWLVQELGTKANLKLAADKRNVLVQSTVIPSDRVPQLIPVVSELLGPAAKPAGETARWKNWFDPFFKAVGGCEKQQSLWSKPVDDKVALYLAFWPWASEPTRTSLRAGIACWDPAQLGRLEAFMKPR